MPEATSSNSRSVTVSAPCVNRVGVFFLWCVCVLFVFYVRAPVDCAIDSWARNVGGIHEPPPLPSRPIPQSSTSEVLPLHCISLSPPPLPRLTRDWFRGLGGGVCWQRALTHSPAELQRRGQQLPPPSPSLHRLAPSSRHLPDLHAEHITRHRVSSMATAQCVRRRESRPMVAPGTCGNTL